MQGKAWAPICRAAANLGVRARGWETGVIPGGGFGRQLRCGGGEMDLQVGPRRQRQSQRERFTGGR